MSRSASPWPRDIQRFIQEIGQPIQFLDGGDNRLGLLDLHNR